MSQNKEPNIDTEKLQKLIKQLNPDDIGLKHIIDAVSIARTNGLNFSGALYEKAKENELKRHADGSTYCKFVSSEEKVIRAGTALSDKLTSTRNSPRQSN